MSDSTPIYNLKAVMQEVGLSAATLRAWEQRYDLLKPQRTAGGHRLYSRQEIEMLKWLVDRQKEGLSISRAIEMWKALKLDERNSEAQVHMSEPEINVDEGMLDLLRERWTAACLVFDEQTANHVLDQAFAIALPETVCIEVLQKGLAFIGEGWYTREVSVQQEHFTSAIAMRRLNTLLAAAAPPTRAERILAACPPGEVHDFILLLITYLLRRKGWDVVYLGANVPLQDLDTAIQSTKPDLVLSAAQTLAAAASLRTTSEFLIRLGTPLAFGGRIFDQVPETIHRISGYYLGNNVPMVPNVTELLVMTPPAMPAATPLAPAYSHALGRFLQNESFIVGYVVSAMQTAPVDPAHLKIADENFTELVYSALILGEINLLDPSVVWLNGLLGNYGISIGVVDQFYTIYRQAVERYLGEDGALIRDWLSKQLSA